MPRVAFLTMDSLEGFVSYDHLVSNILEARGIPVDEVSWRPGSVDWNAYALVIIRSPWDYQQAPQEFLSVLETIDASRARLMNPLSVVRWNVEKTYLQQMSNHGVSIVPTCWVKSPTVTSLQALFEHFSSCAIVIKPVVGAGACDTFWLRPDSPVELFQQIEQLYQNRLALVQPFVTSVIPYGELSLIYFGGEFSHTVLKTPRAGDFRVQEEHGGIIRAIVPDPAIVEFACRSLAVVPDELLYARVDIVLLEDNQPAVMELELIEPSLYLSCDSQAPVRFANAIESRL